MAKPITATPVVTGKAAEKIWKEMREGSQNTPERTAAFQRAKGALESLKESPFRRTQR